MSVREQEIAGIKKDWARIRAGRDQAWVHAEDVYRLRGSLMSSIRWPGAVPKSSEDGKRAGRS